MKIIPRFIARSHEVELIELVAMVEVPHCLRLCVESELAPQVAGVGVGVGAAELHPGLVRVQQPPVQQQVRHLHHTSCRERQSSNIPLIPNESMKKCRIQKCRIVRHFFLFLAS